MDLIILILKKSDYQYQICSIEMLRILNYSLNSFAYNHWIFHYYDSVYVENRHDIDCFKTLIKFKVYYIFIDDNNDINYVTTSNCMNLTKVRDNLNKFNDTFHHINYLPIELPPTEALTYQIVTWIIFSIVLLTRIYNYILQNNNISVLKMHLIIYFRPKICLFCTKFDN